MSRKSCFLLIAALLGISLVLWMASAIAWAAPLEEVWPTGNVASDKNNIQTAVTNVDVGGTVLLHATDSLGNPTPFRFKKLAVNMALPPGQQTADASNCRVAIPKSMTIKGETVGGYQTTIVDGYWTFMIAMTASAAPGDVTIQGIHFKDSGVGSILVLATNTGNIVNITGNRITRALYERFAGKPKPCWDSTQGWSSDGSKIRMQDMTQRDADGQFHDVTNDYSPTERVEAWKDAMANLSYNPVQFYTDQTGKNIYLYGWWNPMGVLVGTTSAGYPGAVKGPVNVIANHINLEEDNINPLPTHFERMWYWSYPIYALVSKRKRYHI